MSKIKLKWVTGKRLIERWEIGVMELQLAIKAGLPVYNLNFELEDRGPIYVKTPNPDYVPNDYLSKKYIIKKNNLHDFQVLLGTGRPFYYLGFTNLYI